MFARVVEFIPKVEKQEELIKVLRNEVPPILKKQPGFLLPFLPETSTEESLTVTLWAEKRDADRYEREVSSEGSRDREAVSDHSNHFQALCGQDVSLPALHGGPDGLTLFGSGLCRSGAPLRLFCAALSRLIPRSTGLAYFRVGVSGQHLGTAIKFNALYFL